MLLGIKDKQSPFPQQTWKLFSLTAAFGCVVYVILYETKIIKVKHCFLAIGQEPARSSSNDSTRVNAVLHETSSANMNVIWIHSWTRATPKYPAWPKFSEGALDLCTLPKGMKCEYTADKADYNKSHAILMKGRQIKNVNVLPPYRLPHHKWIFFEVESPAKTWSFTPDLNTSAIRSLFNLTSTYTVDSDVPKRFPLSCTRNQKAFDKLASKNFASGKTRNIMWFVSHCNTSSKRELYVDELKNHIDVDIYGDCGDLKCGQPGYKRKPEKDDCDKYAMSTKYRFYLSFENSLCDMYVTEKLSQILNRRMILIPIVMGYANYSAMIPPDSYIDVRDFRSPQLLARYLHKISKDDDLFNQYIRSKNSIECRSSQSYPCRLCKYLHMNKHKEQIVKDVVDFWGVEKRCVTTSQFWKKH